MILRKKQTLRASALHVQKKVKLKLMKFAIFSEISKGSLKDFCMLYCIKLIF